jgi:hypothetical protein
MYKKGSIIPTKGSAALLNNNLAIASNPANKSIAFAIICRNYISIVSDTLEVLLKSSFA